MRLLPEGWLTLRAPDAALLGILLKIDQAGMARDAILTVASSHFGPPSTDMDGPVT
jgi:hypothetical protein